MPKQSAFFPAPLVISFCKSYNNDWEILYVGHFVRRMWRSNIAGLGVPRRDRANGAYRAYVPDKIDGMPIVLAGDVAADVTDAEVAINRLDAKATALTNTEALARLLLRAESVASSHIEGLQVSAQRLLRADINRAQGLPVNDETAVEVLANVDAMEYAIREADAVSVKRLIEVHRRLLAPTRAAAHAGKIRDEQNWIGGSNFNPIEAVYVPPPPEKLRELLADLCSFCNDDALPAVAQAAIAHAQFETIHPFVDGNGRTGRALIYMVLKRRGLALRTTPPISLVLATRSKEYVDRLNATRSDGSLAKPDTFEKLNRWIGFFAGACLRAVDDANLFEQRVSAIQADWLSRIPVTRAHSTTVLLINMLPAAPVLTVAAAAKLTGRTFAAANNAIEALVAVSILKPTKANLRNRTFEAHDLIAAFTDLERQLASPNGNTRISKPARSVPSRRIR